MRGTVVIEVPVQSAAGDDKLGPKVVELLRSGEGDVTFFSVTRLFSRVKRRKDSVDSGPMRVEWRPEP